MIHLQIESRQIYSSFNNANPGGASEYATEYAKDMRDKARRWFAFNAVEALKMQLFLHLLMFSPSPPLGEVHLQKAMNILST